jgi:hypothetical protein
MNLSQLYHFSGQKEGEQIVLVVRRHWFNIIQSLLPVFAMAILLVGGYLYLPKLFPVFENDAFSGILVFLETLFAMIIWVLMFLIWIDYYFDVWIITNKRVVNVDQQGLFNRAVSEVELEKIQDITTDVKGIIPTFMNYGDVFIQTAAERERFDFCSVPDPYGIKDIIMNLQKEKHQVETNSLGEMIREEIHRDDI